MDMLMIRESLGLDDNSDDNSNDNPDANTDDYSDGRVSCLLLSGVVIWHCHLVLSSKLSSRLSSGSASGLSYMALSFGYVIWVAVWFIAGVVVWRCHLALPSGIAIWYCHLSCHLGCGLSSEVSFGVVIWRCRLSFQRALIRPMFLSLHINGLVP
jgi:hypothetical protein